MLTTLRPRLKDEGCRDLVGKLMVVNFVIFAIMLGGLVGGRLKGGTIKGEVEGVQIPVGGGVEGV